MSTSIRFSFHSDFAAIRRDGSLSVRVPGYTLAIGQIVVLDDNDGTRCRARVLNPHTFRGTHGLYASVLPIPDSWERYEP